MAHSCPDCGMLCYCGGDIDDCEFDDTPEQMRCGHCADRDNDNDEEPIETMQPHQQRVIDEKRELDVKRVKLATFLDGDTYRGLDPSEQARLRRQADAMMSYALILQERIDAFAP